MPKPATIGAAAAYAALALAVLAIPHGSVMHATVMASGHLLLAAFYIAGMH